MSEQATAPVEPTVAFLTLLWEDGMWWIETADDLTLTAEQRAAIWGSEGRGIAPL
jgi:hypothetical protein